MGRKNKMKHEEERMLNFRSFFFFFLNGVCFAFILMKIELKKMLNLRE